MPMTAKQVYKNTLIELNKVNAPALKLYEFNYYVNKAIEQYVNRVYNVYDTSQQTTDDLRVLQGSAYLTPTLVKSSNEATITKPTENGQSKYAAQSSIYGAAYECWLPMDYLHLLNCTCTFKVKKSDKCLDSGAIVQRSATRLTADSWGQVLGDFYNRPSFNKPYYQIYNQNRGHKDISLPMDPVRSVGLQQAGLNNTQGTDIDGTFHVDTNHVDGLASPNRPGSNQIRVFRFSNNHNESLVERSAAQRIGNISNIRLEIRCGRNNPKYELVEVQVDYLRVPQYVRLTQDELDRTTDHSQMMEWPDYVCQEIINLLLGLIMERSNDPRLGNNLQINQTIARPNVSQ